jgi:Na+/melibiose symporter-like transporter
LLALSVPLLVAFWRYEHRLESAGRSPLIRPSLLLVPGLRRTLAATFFFYFLAPFFLTFAIYEQVGLGHGALAASLAILPVGVGLLMGPLSGPYIARRLGNRTAGFGMGLEVCGLVLTAALVKTGAPSWLPAPLLLIGVGQGIALPALVRLNVDKVDVRWAGLAAGLVSATLQVSAAVSVALVGGLFFAIAPDDQHPEAVRLAFAIAALAIGAALALAAVLSLRRRDHAVSVLS